MTLHANKQPNSLANESSPYLLQHAYNPVNWLPFGPAAFEKARKENKPLLISIGYSACHWCHVMEQESFEDDEVAKLMNHAFVNVKVDREERADVDMLYMQAVQLMTGRGGWPLNCFVLPDGRPFYGGTYFPKAQWIKILTNLSDICKNDPEKVTAYADELMNGIRKAELITTTLKEEKDAGRDFLANMVNKWKERLDNENGGPNRAPKFPLPSNYQFLLRYAILTNDLELLDHVHLTLRKMALGGIYDQLSGGFARYSTDMLWKVPHFEKMLYDNAQLVSLYCEAYALTGHALYKETVIGTLEFVRTEWYNTEGFFYSAFDADSDGEEGKYYVWRKEDLEELLGGASALFCKYYQVNEIGYWEHGNYILMRTENPAALAAETEISLQELEERMAACLEVLKQEIKSRIKPGLDDKSITSWNAMMCSACAKAYLTFGDSAYREMALKSVNFITQKLMDANGRLLRTYKNGVAKIDAFLEDFAFTIDALIHCYLITQDEAYLRKAELLSDMSLREFNNPESELLFFTGKSAQPLAARITETSDNVTPASNSQMALNLHYLGICLGRKEWLIKAEKMLKVVLPEMQEYGAGYSNWGCLALLGTFPSRELVVVGNNVNEILLELWQHGLTNTILAVNAKASDLPLLKGRFVEGKTMIYVCENNTCQLPVTSVEEALKLLA
jgi:uncharacterized protein YyaL (SSP411 family)